MSEQDEMQLVRPSDLAEILGVSKGRVSQMIKDGLPRQANGLINIAEAQAWVSANVARRLPKNPQRWPETVPVQAEQPEDYQTLRAKHEALKAEMTALRLAKEAGTTVGKDKAQSVIYARARQEREAHENFVVRVSPLLAAELGAPERTVLAALDRHMRQHLEDLSRMPLELFEDDDHDRDMD